MATSGGSGFPKFGCYEGTLLASAARTTSSDNTSTPSNVKDYKEANFFLEVTAASGTNPTLDITVKTKDPISGEYHVIATFTQKTTTGREMKTLSANLGAVIAAFWVIGGTTPSFTFSIGMILKA